jgi:hypothetical protein
LCDAFYFGCSTFFCNVPWPVIKNIVRFVRLCFKITFMVL